MIEKMCGWKVIKNKSRESARSSLWFYDELKDDFNLNYPVNELVFPKFMGSKILFFDTKYHAEIFANVDDIVVPCIAYNVTRPKNVCVQVLNVKQFWKKYNNKKSTKGLTRKAPDGTLFAESIKCLE